MNGAALRLGALQAEGHQIVRSGLRWLVPSGQHVRSGQPIAYCNISLEAQQGRLASAPPFANELELQVVLASPLAGRLTCNDGAHRGGYLSIRNVEAWDPSVVVATIEGALDNPEGGLALRRMVVAGRRMTNLADVHSGLLAGWHSRSRGFWIDDDAPSGAPAPTLLSLGICDATGVILGEQCAFLEMFEAAPQFGLSGAQIVFVPDHPISPCAPILLDQLTRTDALRKLIADDIRAELLNGAVPAEGPDAIFAGVLMQNMQHSPLVDRTPVFTARGLKDAAPPDYVLVSLNAEPQTLLRHKKIGYFLHIMRHHQAAAGPALKHWLATAFETVRRTTQDIQADYERLIDALAEKTGARLIVLNRMSTSGHEDISNYMGFDAPLSDTLANVASKALNLMLHDIAETRDLDIIDVDALAAALGGAQHLPDGIHQSGAMQRALRQQILQLISPTDLPANKALRNLEFNGEVATGPL